MPFEWPTQSKEYAYPKNTFRKRELRTWKEEEDGIWIQGEVCYQEKWNGKNVCLDINDQTVTFSNRKNGTIQGMVVIIYQNGYKSTGLLVDDESYGTWTFTKPDGTTFDKEFFGRLNCSIRKTVANETLCTTE